MNISTEKKITDLENRLVVAWEGVEWIGSLGLMDANCCFWNELVMRSCYVALGTMSGHLWWSMIMWQNRLCTCMCNWVTMLYNGKNRVGEITKKIKKTKFYWLKVIQFHHNYVAIKYNFKNISKRQKYLREHLTCNFVQVFPRTSTRIWKADSLKDSFFHSSLFHSFLQTPCFWLEVWFSCSFRLFIYAVQSPSETH